MSMLHLCTHPARATYYIPSVYAGPSALTCVLAASNGGRALCVLRTVFMQLVQCESGFSTWCTFLAEPMTCVRSNLVGTGRGMDEGTGTGEAGQQGWTGVR
jgi:hypothetical protein